MRNVSPACTLASHRSRLPRCLGFGLAVHLPSPGTERIEADDDNCQLSEEQEAIGHILPICPKFAEARTKWLHNSGQKEIYQRVHACVIPFGL